MIAEQELRIRERAHVIWEREGRPEGRAVAHWQMAAAEIASETSGTAAARARPRAVKAAAKPAAAKKAAPAAAKKAAPAAAARVEQPRRSRKVPE